VEDKSYAVDFNGGQNFGEGVGMVFIHGELWRAAAPTGATIQKSALVRVRKVERLVLHVEPVKSSQ